MNVDLESIEACCPERWLLFVTNKTSPSRSPNTRQAPTTSSADFGTSPFQSMNARITS
jgi:hypothetical protein